MIWCLHIAVVSLKRNVMAFKFQMALCEISVASSKVNKLMALLEIIGIQ